MICKDCGQFFVRQPCPSCGTREKKDLSHEDAEESLRKPSEMRKEPMPGELQEEEGEEKLLRPSQMKTQVLSQEEEIDPDERLVKPSQLVKEAELDEEDEREEERLIRPSQLRGGSAVNPNFEKTISDDSSQQVLLKETSTKQLTKQELRPIDKQVRTIHYDVKTDINSNLKTKGETDEEYKTRVRETLEDVMALLEKLIE
ncbi:MAG: hypothetical protein ACXAD7_01100 [Candidatus Kariarchaeaceae archaeon]